MEKLFIAQTIPFPSASSENFFDTLDTLGVLVRREMQNIQTNAPSHKNLSVVVPSYHVITQQLPYFFRGYGQQITPIIQSSFNLAPDCFETSMTSKSTMLSQLKKTVDSYKRKHGGVLIFGTPCFTNTIIPYLLSEQRRWTKDVPLLSPGQGMLLRLQSFASTTPYKLLI